jgi:hypothetical protein
MEMCFVSAANRQLKARSRFSRWSAIVLGLIFLASGTILLATRSATIRGYYQTLSYKPVSGTDFKLMKITYYDLYQLDSTTYHLAGAPSFPFETDSLSPVTSGSMRALEEAMRKEVVNNVAYGLREKEKYSSHTYKRVIPTNTFVKLSGRQDHEIKNIVISSLIGASLTNVHLSMVVDPEAEAATLNASNAPSQVAEALSLFRTFIKYKKNGISPHGASYALTFDQLVNIYGYGQCDNLSYALSDLFYKHGIKSHLIYLQSPSHTLVEANINSGARVAFDPLFAIAFVNPATNAVLSFEQVKADVDRALSVFVSDEATRKKAKYQYAGSITSTKQVTPLASVNRTYNVLPEETVEYDFSGGYPWITLRNITPPPEGVLGFFKKHTHVEPNSTEGQSRNVAYLRVEMPFPIVDAEIHGLSSGNRPDIFMDPGEVQKVQYDQSWEFVSLRRYIQNYPVMEELGGITRFQRNIELTFDYNNRVPQDNERLDISVISEISSLPYYRFMDGFVKVSADQNLPVMLTINYQ